MLTLPPKDVGNLTKYMQQLFSYIGHIAQNSKPERRKTSIVSPMNSPAICLEMHSGPWCRVDDLVPSRVWKSCLIEENRDWDLWSLT